MSRHSEKAMCMIERNIAAIGASACPSAEYVLGIVEAMYHMGHIGEDDQYKFTQAAFDAVIERRTAVLKAASDERRKKSVERCERRAA